MLNIKQQYFYAGFLKIVDSVLKNPRIEQNIWLTI
ncbi:hypothetical protein B6N60_02074 [Richelia sinica FACHB-800]|uniref:Uncharacterized protein n=1 Tax=Richelia sinica FACHB-800 TaxID=1357546 RepID=A0A975Y4P1_9NOST|nr:hypothetical protein B6N60_02074 [Richelia sinica FACHB-800]